MNQFIFSYILPKLGAETTLYGVIRYIFSYILVKLGVEKAPFKPGIAGIEITNACALDCLGCTRHKMTRKVSYMEESVFGEAIKQVASCQGSVPLHYLGDPLLHKDLPKLVKFANEKGVKTRISVKGNLLDKNIGEKLIKAGLGHILFSWYGINKEEFEKAQGGANYEETKRNVVDFLNMRENMSAKNPKAGFEFLMPPPHNYREIYQLLTHTRGEIYKFLKSGIGKVDEWRIKFCHTWSGDSNRVRNFLGKGIKITDKPCLCLWRGELNILVNGDVVPCCVDYDGKYILGNIMKESISEIWNSEGMKSLRRFHISGRKNEIELCKHCNLPEEELGLLPLIRRVFFNFVTVYPYLFCQIFKKI